MGDTSNTRTEKGNGDNKHRYKLKEAIEAEALKTIAPITRALKTRAFEAVTDITPNGEESGLQFQSIPIEPDAYTSLVDLSSEESIYNFTEGKGYFTQIGLDRVVLSLSSRRMFLDDASEYLDDLAILLESYFLVSFRGKTFVGRGRS